MIIYKKGDATCPEIPAGHNAFLLHVCNNIGKWGAGFVLALSNKWDRPEIEYRKQCRLCGLWLGEVQLVEVEKNITVCNMVAQSGIASKNNPTPLKYWALEECLEYVNSIAEPPCIFVGPKFGAGLSGGNWRSIEQLINTCLTKGDTHIYAL